MSFPEELYSSKFSTPGRTYFFDVKKRHGESRRLVLTCSKMQGGGRIRDRLTIVEEDVAEFVAKLLEAVGSMAVAEPRVPKSASRALPRALRTRTSLGRRSWTRNSSMRTSPGRRPLPWIMSP